MKITNIIQAFKAQVLSKKTTHRAPAAGAIKPAKDKVLISDAARSLQRTDRDITVARKALQKLPNVRPDRIAEVRTKLARGAFNQAQFAKELANRISRNPDFLKLISDNATTQNRRLNTIRQTIRAGGPLKRQDKIQQARDRIANGTLNTPGVRAELANRLLKNFGV